jgi:hypothetical protein
MPELNELEIYTLNSCKSNNAVNSAILMNPTNYAIPNLPILVTNTTFSKDNIITNIGNINQLNPNLISSDSVPNKLIPPLTLISDYNGKIIYQKTNSWYHNWGIIHTMIKKIVPGTPADLTCAAGIGTAFAACIHQKSKIYTTGDFPNSSSSQLITAANFKGENNVIILKPNEDYAKDGKGYLTASGLKKLENFYKWKGAVFNFTNPNGRGHIGMVLGFEIIKEPTTGKDRCWLYTLEFNTKTSSAKDLQVVQNPDEFVKQILAQPGINYYNYTELKKNPKYKLKIPAGKNAGSIDPQYNDGVGGDERTGGKLAFRLRLIGGDADTDPVRFTLGNTTNFTGGSWAPKGLAENNEYLYIGKWKDNKKIFEV